MGSMSGYVYVLKSGRNGRYYIGSTDHLIRRYYQRARGLVHTTARMLPVQMDGWREFETLADARRAERTLKKKKSRASVQSWLNSQSAPM
jgi:predicted GIY-YIG superfamily endonuclease